MKQTAKNLLCAALCLILCAACLLSCGQETPAGTETGESGSGEERTERETEELPVCEPLPPIGSVIDEDADSVEGIAIRSAEDLRKIGKDDAYPLDGDYVLVADIDLTGAPFEPIGEIETDSVSVPGGGVFSGTFDGRGHMIVGLNIAVSASARVHVGMFGTVASDTGNDRAAIRNLILKDAAVTGEAEDESYFAILCGRTTGFVDIDNIAIVGGSVEAVCEGSDMLGAAALVGECRADTGSKITNRATRISNIFSSASVSGTNDGRPCFASGVIGRIRGSDVGSVRSVVQVGTVTRDGKAGEGSAVATGSYGARDVSDVYYLAGCGVARAELGTSATSAELSSGALKPGGDLWRSEPGLYPMPEIVHQCPYLSALDFVCLSLADGDSADLLQNDFALPAEVMGQKVIWTSSDPSVIRITEEGAKVTKPALGSRKVTLSARTADGEKDFPLSVFSGVYGSIRREGDTLIPENYPEGTAFRWKVRPIPLGAEETFAGETLTLNPELSVLVTLCADGVPDAYYYESSLPTVYITSRTPYSDVQKGVYTSATMNIRTTEKFASTKYDGGIQIKVRGNSTAGHSKRPFKIKLDAKTDLFGMGKNKHWCLLANSYDQTNLRNKISYDFSMDLGLTGCSSELVNVFYNGEYCGLYEFTESVRIGKTRVDIFDWEEEAEDVAEAIARAEKLSEQEEGALSDAMERDLSWVTTGVFGNYTLSDYVDTSAWDISGGYLIENDAYYDEFSKFITKNGMKLMLHKPEFLATNGEMMNYLKTYIQNCEDAVYAPNRLSGEGLHYSDYMDVGSFVDFWVVNTLFKNVELLYKSCYFYKPVGGKLVWGPVWDMDWTSGNHVNLDAKSRKYDVWDQGQSKDRGYWYKALYNDPWFILLLYERWNGIGDKIDAMLEHYDEVAEEIREEADRDNLLWRYGWTYSRETETLREWLFNRRSWMDSQTTDPGTLLESLGYYEKSERFEIAGAEEDGDGFRITLRVTDAAHIASADVLLNGRIVMTDIPVSDGASFRIAKSDLRDLGLYNSLEVLAKDQNGSYLAVTRRAGQQGSNANEGAWVYLRTP